MAAHFSILAWRISWTEKPDRLQSMLSQNVRHDCMHAHTHARTRTHTHTPYLKPSVKNLIIFIGQYH